MLNHAVIQGRLCADPELRSTGSGVQVCSFRIAWSEKYKESETRLFLNCTAWRSTGEMVSRYFSKGKEILVEGKLFTHEWESKNGDRRTANEMTVERVHFCGPKLTTGESDDSGYVAPEADFSELTDDELPF